LENKQIAPAPTLVSASAVAELLVLRLSDVPKPDDGTVEGPQCQVQERLLAVEEVVAWVNRWYE
jgi:hypothetical protein